MIDALSEGIEKSSYVDDHANNRRCADENDFKFSATKTLCVHFGNTNGLQPEPSLKRYGHKACKLVPLCFTNIDRTAQNQLYLRKLKMFVSYTVSFLKNDAKNHEA